MLTSQLYKRPTLILAFLVATFSMVPVAFAQSSNDIVGIWETEDGGLKFEMFNAGSEYQARLLYGRYVMEPDNVTFLRDTKNPDEALSSRSLKHVTILSGLTWQNGEWTGGSFYSPRNGTTVSCSGKIVDGKLHMRGYVGISLLGQTIVFRRVAS
jgi:uncharacterized protein (DUF2147 family)